VADLTLHAGLRPQPGYGSLVFDPYLIAVRYRMFVNQ
jgi:hypothetical protein